MKESSSNEVLVIGGGLAGSAAAIALAQGGRAVTLMEREREPQHKVCGEFLSAEALEILARLDVDPVALGAVPIRGVRLCSAKDVTASVLPFPALSLTRKRLDEAMLEAAETAGVRVVRGSSVDGLTREGGQWRAAPSNGAVMTVREVVLATGKHDVRGHARPKGLQGELVGMKMYWKLQPEQRSAFGQNVELFLFPGGYAGMQPVEDGSVNLCCLVDRDLRRRLGSWDGLLARIRAHCPQARERLEGAEALLVRPLAISAIPYGFVRSKAVGPQMWAVGDQAAVIPSFTGDGMSIALYSGLRAAESLLAGQGAEAFQRKLHSKLRWQVARATMLSRALVQERRKEWLVRVVRLWPSLLRGTARATRIPKQVVKAGLRPLPKGSQ